MPISSKKINKNQPSRRLIILFTIAFLAIVTIGFLYVANEISPNSVSRFINNQQNLTKNNNSGSITSDSPKVELFNKFETDQYTFFYPNGFQQDQSREEPFYTNPTGSPVSERILLVVNSSNSINPNEVNYKNCLSYAEAKRTSSSQKISAEVFANKENVGCKTITETALDVTNAKLISIDKFIIPLKNPSLIYSVIAGYLDSADPSTIQRVNEAVELFVLK